METKGDRLRSLRLNKNLTLDEVGKHIGKNRQAVYKYEKNIVTNIPSDVIEKLSIVLNTTPAYILGWEIEKTETGYTVNDGEEEIKIELIDATKDMSIEQIRELINFAKFMKSEVSKNGKEG